MLAEFALTPAIFDEEAHDDLGAWREQLRELGRCMFPRTAAWPIMVSNLCAGEWHEYAKGLAGKIGNQAVRILCQDILTKAERMLVFRPACLDGWPDDECDWGREALKSSAGEPIDRIVATAKACLALAAKANSIRSLARIHDNDFWEGLTFEGSPPMRIADQIQKLRKLCVHSDFLALVTPHIRGGVDDETDFAIELVGQALRRHAGYPQPEIEIHTQAPDLSRGDAHSARGLERWLANTTRRVKEARVLAKGDKITLCVWQKLLDRLLIGGVFVRNADGSKKCSPRWGVLMGHIARRPDEKRLGEITEWKLLSKESLGLWFEKYCGAGATGCLERRTIAK